MKKHFITALAAILLVACGAPAKKSDQSATEPAAAEAPKKEASPIDILNEKLVKLTKEGKAFAPGSYVKGDIPKGLYAFLSEKGGYYSEEVNDQILDNENFNTFGYVFVQAMGDVKTKGYLINMENIGDLGYDSPKAIYEMVTNQPNYNFSGTYKAGVDIPAGNYILESVGNAYMEVNKGAVGDGNILKNDNFDGRKSVSIRKGQYLKIHNATFSPAK